MISFSAVRMSLLEVLSRKVAIVDCESEICCRFEEKNVENIYCDTRKYHSDILRLWISCFEHHRMPSALEDLTAIDAIDSAAPIARTAAFGIR